jgi:MoaA/NifB/PqqE/SkfB family radical SAM enzyme
MLKEWDNRDEFNSYNSWKGLHYLPWYESIKKWKETKNPKDLLPPIEASIDSSPAGACQLKCRFCNAHKYVGKTSIVSDQQLVDLHKFLIDFGIKAFCEGGGGSPTLRKNLAEIFWLIKKYNRQSSIATNALGFNDKLIDAMANCCRWVGISVDSSNKETYKNIRGVDSFDKTIGNMKLLVKKVKEIKSKCDVSYKFLITPWNYKEIYDACKLAKEIGVRDFHSRPADLSHQGMGDIKLKEYSYLVDKIKEQFEKCHELRTSNFRVITAMHKFDENFKPLKNFSQCYAMPILIQCCPDGNVYACVDQRLVEKFNLGSYIPDPKNILKFWGGKKHYDLVFGNTVKSCTNRCTFSKYCLQAEKLVFESEQDYMCKYFT